jgi:hypothetical protein
VRDGRSHLQRSDAEPLEHAVASRFARRFGCVVAPEFEQGVIEATSGARVRRRRPNPFHLAWRALFASAAFGCASCLAGAAVASPQAHVALRTSVCGVGEERLWQETRWCNAVMGDFLLGRSRNSDFGFGPFVEASTAGFWDARYGGGLSALAPITSDIPVVLSLGAYGHETSAVALGANVFVGVRSYNFHGSYNLAAGLVASFVRDLGSEHATLVTLGVELDGFFLALPFLLAARELR